MITPFHTRNRQARLVALALALLALTCMASVGNAWMFHGKAGTGYVVDAVNGKVLEGVIVEASWVVTNYRDPSAPPLFEAFHDYTVTDPSGRFVLPAWGPIEVDLNSPSKSVLKELSHLQPQLYLYKPGYRLLVAARMRIRDPSGTDSTSKQKRHAKRGGASVCSRLFAKARSRIYNVERVWIPSLSFATVNGSDCHESPPHTSATQSVGVAAGPLTETTMAQAFSPRLVRKRVNP